MIAIPKKSLLGLGKNVVVNADEVEQLNEIHMVCVPTGEYENICTADEAVEKMKSTIGLVNETIPTVISGPELLYIGDYDDSSNTSRFIPAWRFAKKQDIGGKFLKYDFYYYDAQTGAMIQ